MDVVKVSNVFNALTQDAGSGFNFYHSGTWEDINQNGIPNNFDPTNSTGKLYPVVMFPYNATRHTLQLVNKRQEGKLELTLMFCDLMFYGNDSKNDTRTELEIYRDLQAKANGFIAAIQKANRAQIAANKCEWLGVDPTVPIKVDVIPFAHNDRLMCLAYEMTLVYSPECSPFDPDFSNLPADTPLPVLDYDYEDLTHKTDSP